MIQVRPAISVIGKPAYKPGGAMAGFKCGGCGCKIIVRGLCFDCARPGQRTIVPNPLRFARLISR